MTKSSSPDLLVLHAVRLSGFAGPAAIARRFELDRATTEELLLDAQAQGWTSHHDFAGTAGWSLTDRGRAENERQLAAELARTGRADEVRDAYEEFLPLNAALLKACTDWQLRPVPGGRMIPNDHTDPVWDDRVLRSLDSVDRALSPLVAGLAGLLARFGGYDARFTSALGRARAGERSWVDRTDVDSCHRVWFELHEDLIATLGIDRGTQPTS